MNDEIEKEINDRVMKLVNEATDYAENAPYAEPEACNEICICGRVRGRTTCQ